MLFVVNHAGFFLSHRLPLALAAQRSGYEVHIATPQSKHVAQIEQAGLAWHRIRLSRSGKNPLKDVVALVDLVQLYRTLRPAIVHHVTLKPMLYGTIAARVAAVPAVVNAVSGLGHVFISREPLYRTVRFLLGIALRAVLHHRCMRIIFQNEDDRAVFVRSGWVRPEQTVLIAGSGVDTDFFVPSTQAREGAPVVMFASRLLRTKGLPEFLAAVRRMQQAGERARFVVVGDPDPDNPASISAVEFDDLQRDPSIEFWGRRSEMASVLREADVVCLPSHREGMPKVLLEAMACGVAVVTTDVPGCRDAAGEGAGFIVPLGDVAAITNALTSLVRDPSTRATYAAAGRQRVVQRFSLHYVITSVLGLYEELLACARS